MEFIGREKYLNRLQQVRHRQFHDRGVQIDLLFDRADNVITLCEMKYRTSPVGKEIVADVEKKVELLKTITKKTIQRILITRSQPSKDLAGSGYFYRIIIADELM